LKPTSLRVQLLGWLLVPLLLLLSVNAWYSRRAAADTADLSFDRLLLASADAIADDIEVRDGEIFVDLPYAALELLESNIQERIFYRVVAPDGRTVTGYDDLPLPQATSRGDNTLYAAVYRGETVHLVAMNKHLYATGFAQPVVVIVAETGEARDALSRQIVTEALARQALLIAAAALLVGLGLARGLAPLERLRRSVSARPPADLSPVDASGVPAEVRPLIRTLNEHTARIARLLAGRQRWIADASHQMRTPLTEMQTQIAYSLRQDRPELARQALVDVHADIRRLSHLLSQLLMQARSEPEGLAGQEMNSLDLRALAHEATLDHVGPARGRSIDLGFETDEAPARVQGNALLLTELVGNLLRNAIAYGREHGRITVGVQGGPEVTLEVLDDGPGIPAAEREHAFQRFWRSPTVLASGPSGSGLGLSIVRNIVEAHGARIELSSGPDEVGLRVRIVFPAQGGG